jgi:myo-inositol-1(or 4)-monophosphatase
LNPPQLSELEDLAKQAGAMLRAGFEREKQVYYKGTIDLVTDADRQVEEFLIGEIRRRYAGHSIVAEESGQTAGDACCVWYIDPMDGTVNFAHGFPHFCVSIGYLQDETMLFGVVYDPMRAELFSARRGQGAWLNGKPIRVSQSSELDRSLLATEFGYDIRTHPQNNLDYHAYFTLHTLGVRRVGSAALDLCYVACGRFDGYWELRVKPWDLAAGGLIAEEAGARVSTIDGNAGYIHPPCSILAAAPGLHSQMSAVLLHPGTPGG